jgi:hypothetical protein
MDLGLWAVQLSSGAAGKYARAVTAEFAREGAQTALCAGTPARTRR